MGTLLEEKHIYMYSSCFLTAGLNSQLPTNVFSSNMWCAMLVVEMREYQEIREYYFILVGVN